jgi:hypothetical protein
MRYEEKHPGIDALTKTAPSNFKSSVFIFAVTGATAPSQRHAIRTKNFARNFHRLKTPAALARTGFVHNFNGFGFHRTEHSA